MGPGLSPHVIVWSAVTAAFSVSLKIASISAHCFVFRRSFYPSSYGLSIIVYRTRKILVRFRPQSRCSPLAMSKLCPVTRQSRTYIWYEKITRGARLKTYYSTASGTRTEKKNSDVSGCKSKELWRRIYVSQRRRTRGTLKLRKPQNFWRHHWGCVCAKLWSR